ncbi:MAG TPA: SpoIIE family protein phosphatase, partial [Acidobacteriaceae bacterium]
MRRARLLLLPMLVVACLVAIAQQTSNGHPSAPTRLPIEVRLGDSTIPLAGPWKFAPGDSPDANGALLWASPAFDDSAWSDMDLHGRPSETDAAYGDPGYIPGWGGRGFPHLTGFAWYRLRVHLAKSPQALWLKMPDHVDDSYQVFANGRYVGEFGRFTVAGVESFRSRPLTFKLPAPDTNGDMLLAIRCYMEPWVLVSGTAPESGGMHEVPLLGLRSQIESIRAQEVTGRILSVLTSIFVALFMLIGAAGAFWIWLLDRPRTTYLWLTLGLVFVAASTPALLVAFFSYALTQAGANILVQTSNILGLVCWIFFWRQWFELPRQRWPELLVTLSAAIRILMDIFIRWSAHAPPSLILFAIELRAACSVILGIMLFVVLLQGARKDRTGALLALPPIILIAISLLSVELLTWFGVRTSIFPFGIQIGVNDVALVLLVLVTGALVARRFVSSQVSQRLERQTVDREMEQARELQQHVLTPEPVSSSLFTVETAYHPARTVGGDFFQVLAHADGSLLIVVGDVSGKGIAAAMLVAVLVGAIRTRADESFDPAAILDTLNDRLLGRAGGHFATCVVAHLRPGGAMLVANAGHLPPYRNGIAIDLPGSIPLGILRDAQYELHTIHLDPADHLTFLTDGVLEARNIAGQLLGFEQTAALSSLPPEAIARAAIHHGQDDDITVVSVRVGLP